MSKEKLPTNDLEEIKAERLQARREHFDDVLKTVCRDKQYTYKRITGSDDINEDKWVEFRFVPLDKNGENLPDYEFNKFVDELIKEINSDEHYITWFEHPSEGQVVKIEIDES